jgi:hypothetical protein
MTLCPTTSSTNPRFEENMYTVLDLDENWRVVYSPSGERLGCDQYTRTIVKTYFPENLLEELNLSDELSGVLERVGQTTISPEEYLYILGLPFRLGEAGDNWQSIPVFNPAFAVEGTENHLGFVWELSPVE